jgi:hypothetical protein
MASRTAQSIAADTSVSTSSNDGSDMRSFLAQPEIKLALASVFVLVACGGGGGGGTEAIATVGSSSGGSSSTSSLTYIDSSVGTPSGSVGTTAAKKVSTLLQPKATADGVGAFRTVCLYSHMSNDDPIVYPNQPGLAHLHSFFGNKASNANSSTDSIANSGASTCRGGILNRSSYWVPSMVAPGGRPMAPYDIVAYYKTGYQGLRNDQITVPPVGLRIIGGNSKSRVPQEHVTYGCSPFAEGDVVVAPAEQTVPTCVPGEQLMLRVEYPQCWDGRNLTSPDGKSHMAYGNYLTGCPAGFQVPIPAITFTVKWRVPAGTTTAGWRLSSDIEGTPAGSSGHADWWNGWDHDTMTTWVQHCINANQDCGTYLLGDGTMLDD